MVQVAIYLDVLGLLNFGADFLILFLTGLILNKRLVVWRLMLGALLGTVVLLPVLFVPLLISSGSARFIMCVTGSLGAAAVAYGEKGKPVAREWLATALVMLCLGGTMYGVKGLTGMEGMTFGGWTLGLAAGGLSAVSLVRLFGNMGCRQKPLFQIRIRRGDRYIEETVLLDTGNMLWDPLFGRPVILLAEQAASGLLTKEEQSLVREYQKNGRLPYERLAACGSQRKLCFHELSYCSVGKQEGKLLCFLAEEVVVCERERVFRRQPVAVVASELFLGRAYRGLLHRDCL